MTLTQSAGAIHARETEAQRQAGATRSWGAEGPHPSPPQTPPFLPGMPEGMSRLTRGMDSSLSVASARVQGPPISPGCTPGPSTASTTSP